MNRGSCPVNTKHLHNICTTSAQRLRRWADVVQILYECFVFTGTDHILNNIISDDGILSAKYEHSEHLFKSALHLGQVILIHFEVRIATFLKS